MLEVLPDVFVLEANGRKGFGFSHFVRLADGNVLLPRLKQVSLSESFDALHAAGGVAWVLVSDRHFAGPGCVEAAARFDAPLVISDIEAKAVGKRMAVEAPLTFERQCVSSRIEAIPLPGHSPGQLAYLIETEHDRCLFPGDFASVVAGEWRPGNRSRKAMQRGIEHLEDVAFDYWIGCADYAEESSFVEVANGVRDIADAILAACSRP